MTKSIYHHLTGLAVATLLTACASSRQFAPLAEAAVNEATVYVIRTSAAGGSIPFGVYCDSSKVGMLGPKAYLRWTVKEGTHLLAIAGESRKNYALVAKAGETYYFKAIPQIGLFIARAKLELMMANDALAALTKIRKPAVDGAVN